MIRRPWLWLPPKLAHDLSGVAVELCSLLHEKRTPEWGSFFWRGIEFKNRLGLAGGADKNAEHLKAWQNLGCGFIEVGTVTPEPQAPNPGKIFDRSLPDHALWNKMGFPSAGGDETFYNLTSALPDISVPVLVNIGKNRVTPNERAFEDYNLLLEKFHGTADAFVVNISSPNTQGLRDLAKASALEDFLRPLAQKRKELNSEKPVLLKLSPDLEHDDLKRILDVAVENAMDGFVLTNTTLSRKTTRSFPAEGGLSGRPVSLLSKESLKTAIGHLGAEKANKLVISAGGVMTADDVFERISLGADLVEVYTALIFSGLNFFRKVEKSADESRQKVRSSF